MPVLGLIEHLGSVYVLAPKSRLGAIVGQLPKLNGFRRQNIDEHLLELMQIGGGHEQDANAE